MPLSGSITAPSRPAKRLAYILALASACVLIGWTARPAHAITGSYCPPTFGSTITLQAYGSPSNTDRCAHSYHSTHNWINYHNSATTVEKCAVLKPNSDGSGGNVGGLAAACATGTGYATQYPTGLGGYATGINKGAFAHPGFHGSLDY